jgi:two-component system, OmpR family, alkaline phosphatase synthesis response regulator PhoP
MPPTSKSKILIVDDDKFLLDMYSLKFTQEGFDPEIAFSGPEAIQKIESGSKPDICLVDIIMPQMNGFELIGELRKRNVCNTLIILSNLGQKEDIEKGLQAGADGYIIKASATPSEVVTRVKDIVKSKN